MDLKRQRQPHDRGEAKGLKLPVPGACENQVHAPRQQRDAENSSEPDVTQILDVSRQ